MTLRERFGRLEGLRLAYVGDGNNVCHSLMLLGAAVGVEVAVASPAGARPDAGIVRAGGRPRQRRQTTRAPPPPARTPSTRTCG